MSWFFVWLPVAENWIQKCYTATPAKPSFQNEVLYAGQSCSASHQSREVLTQFAYIWRLAVPASTPSTPNINHAPAAPRRQQHRYQRTLGSWKLKTSEAQADPRQIDFEGPSAASGLEKFQHVFDGCHNDVEELAQLTSLQKLCQTKRWTRRMKPRQFQALSFLPVKLAKKIVASWILIVSDVWYNLLIRRNTLKQRGMIFACIWCGCIYIYIYNMYIYVYIIHTYL